MSFTKPTLLTLLKDLAENELEIDETGSIHYKSLEDKISESLFKYDVQEFFVAIKKIESDIQNNPKKKSLYLQKAELHNCCKNYEEALGAIDHALALDHDYRLAKCSKATICSNWALAINLPKNDFQGALNILNEAIDLWPQNRLFYANKSHVYNKMSNFHEAIRQADISLKLEPSFRLAKERKAQALISFAERILNESPDSIDLAFEKINLAEKILPKDKFVLFKKAKFYYDRGDYKNAYSYSSKSLYIHEDYEEAQNLKSLALYQLSKEKFLQNEIEEAHKLIEEAHYLNPDSISINKEKDLIEKKLNLLEQSVIDLSSSPTSNKIAHNNSNKSNHHNSGADKYDKDNSNTNTSNGNGSTNSSSNNKNQTGNNKVKRDRNRRYHSQYNSSQHKQSSLDLGKPSQRKSFSERDLPHRKLKRSKTLQERTIIDDEFKAHLNYMLSKGNGQFKTQIIDVKEMSQQNNFHLSKATIAIIVITTILVLSLSIFCIIYFTFRQTSV